MSILTPIVEGAAKAARRIVTSKYILPVYASMGLAVTSALFRDKTKVFHTGAMAVNVFTMSVLDHAYRKGSNLVPHRPCGMIGGIPLTNIQVEEITHSDKQTKFRASGSSFFAHQIGDSFESTIAIRGVLMGPTRHLVIEGMDDLLQISKKQLKKNMTTQAGTIIPSSAPATEDDEDSYIVHRTYPLILPEGMYFNAFVESFQILRNIENGPDDSVGYLLYVRLFEPPSETCTVTSGVIKLPLASKYTYAVMNRVLNFSYRLGNYVYESGSKRYLMTAPRSALYVNTTSALEPSVTTNTSVDTEANTHSTTVMVDGNPQSYVFHNSDMNPWLERQYRWRELPTPVHTWESKDGKTTSGVRLSYKPKSSTDQKVALELFEVSGTGSLIRKKILTLSRGWYDYVKYSNTIVRCDFLRKEYSGAIPDGFSVKIDLLRL